MPVLDHDALIKPDDNQIIWRYLDMNKFESMLSEKSLFFCRSDKFSDPFEGSIPKKEAEYRIKSELEMAKFFKREISYEEAVKKSADIGNLHKNFKRSFTVNCWHINKGESDAMWRLYLKTNEGVAIQSTVAKLRESFQDNPGEIWISNVRYLDYENDIWFDSDEYPVKGYNLFTPIVHKRSAFAHENELRIFQQFDEAVHDETYWENEANQMGTLIPANIDILLDKIILPPTADSKVQDMVNQLMTEYQLDREIEKSKLNEEPSY